MTSHSHFQPIALHSLFLNFFFLFFNSITCIYMLPRWNLIETRPEMKKIIFTHKFLPGIKQVESHSGMKFSLNMVSYTMVSKKTCFSQLLKWEAWYGTFNYYIITNHSKFGPLIPLVCTCSILVAPSPLELSKLKVNPSSYYHHVHHHPSQKQLILWFY